MPILVQDPETIHDHYQVKKVEEKPKKAKKEPKYGRDENGVALTKAGKPRKERADKGKARK